jgi:hypothetical protein
MCPAIYRSALRWVTVAIAVALSACSAYAPTQLTPGSSVANAIQSMGAPTGRYALPDGRERLEFARGPYGKHTWMLDFDAQGRLLGSTQVLTEGRFDTIVTGMSRDDVLRAIGHPSDVRSIAHQGQTVWAYRFDGPFCRWFQVGLDGSERVVDTSYGPDPLCEGRDNVDVVL